MTHLLKVATLLLTIFSLMLAPSLLAQQRVKEQAVAESNLQRVGQGQMKWMLFNLYQAHFYSRNGQYQEGHYPQALILAYQKSISRDALIEATLEEWQRLNIKVSPSWVTQLTRIWPSVNKGDELAIRVSKSGVSTFYFNQKVLGEIHDPDFGPAFLAIWLSEDSRNPKLTRQLKGQ
ncbi:chalcone isomerase family protein [Oceanisphaera avium]|uniref:Chalcone isomerase domain-containing protein n=1 Tax=Oceanisphaera avium TaxID=1903694 RepID=A0A1Y0CXF5_9GAMM|nr:chalcone isomerase family protein [Oceanisphaera avium]ART79577.1 hypothetical protein CBP12_04930 [Oceanisphaera avium]